MRRIICFTAAVTITITSAYAAELSAMGIGTQSCGQFAKQYQLSPREFENSYFAWAQGYMSGLNGMSLEEHGTSRDLSTFPVDQQEQLLRLYCNEHPLAMYMQGVTDLFMKFSFNKPLVK